MKIESLSKRHFLNRLLLSLPFFSFLSACGFGDNSQQVVDSLIKLLRHHGVAAHIGRLNVESNPSLKSLTKKELADDILSQIGLNFNTFADSDASSIRDELDKKIRQDFTDENVVAVDGWLLSQTEAKICALVYRNLETKNS